MDYMEHLGSRGALSSQRMPLAPHNSDEQAGLNLGQFSKIDGSESSIRFLDELDRRDRAPFAVGLRKHLYDHLQATPGEKVADVGCGTGKVVAELIESGVQAIGIDVSEQVIARARHRFPTADFRLASSEKLPFADAELRGYAAMLLYQHLNDPAPSLVEAWRVLGPGGRLVVADLENDLWAIDCDDPSIVRKMLPAFADTIANPWIGRRLRSLLIDAGFGEVTVETHSIVVTSLAAAGPLWKAVTGAGVAAGVVTTEQADAWLDEQADRDAHGRLFAAIPVFFACATRL
jgi:ubiquinone/menaquinone biosynthesis C-methylase UbiE